MAVSKQVLVYYWISLGLIPLTTCTEENGQDYGRRFLESHEGIVYEFVQEPMPWVEARERCETQGGHLLRDLNDEIKELLRRQLSETGPLWVSRDVMYTNSIRGFEPTTPVSYSPLKDDGSDVNKAVFACSYMVIDPFQLVNTPNCSGSFGSLCLRDEGSDFTHLKRSRRSLTDILTSMAGLLSTTQLLENAKQMLSDLETTTEPLPKEKRLQFLQNIYDHLLQSDVTDKDKLAEIANSTAAMLLFSQECGTDNMDGLEDIISLAGHIYVKTLATNGNLVMELPTGTIYVTSQDSSTLGGQMLGSRDGGYCQLPSLSSMTKQLPSGKVNLQLFHFKENPTDLKSNETITGTTCSFSLQQGNTSVKFTNLPENIEIYLPRPGAPQPEVVDITWKQGYAVTSTFNISDANVTVIATAIPNQNISLRFTLFPPDAANTTISNQSTIVTYKDGYRWLITPEMIQRVDGTWKVSVLPHNYTSSGTLTFKVSVFVTKCLFWDQELGDWSREGCMVGPNTMPNLTHCLCNHTTFFGSSFFVMPNQVDLSQTAALFSTVNENYIVVSLLSCFFALYLVGVMWAWYADRKALRTRKMTLLEDNHPCAQYNYLLYVQTGHRRGAGTTAKVMMTLQFSEGESESYRMSDPEKPMFERGAVDVFLLSIPFSLGELQSIEISHDNSGRSPDWYLDKVQAQDLQTMEVSHFLCSSWLRGETCKRTFNSAKMNEIASFGNIFQTRTSSGFRDEHIWVSIVDPPRRSPSPACRGSRAACLFCSAPWPLTSCSGTSHGSRVSGPSKDRFF
ncbi:polycystic kidney disease protein 1-like [Pimephales promelas]|nr:polycystic kidney disease protein 1-like [Pimephales promelas]KAG1926583.1 polycystic kidney disease protein 1-like [Pimephales promelas]